MTSIEMTGKSIDEATQLALEQLGVTEDDVYVEILDEGAKGFLGLGQTPARVKVTVKDKRMPFTDDKSTAETGPCIEEPKVGSSDEYAESATLAEPVTIDAQFGQHDAADHISEEDPAEAARASLQSILDGIGLGGMAVVKSASSEAISLNIDGGDSGVLIGKHGQTINAMQYLVGLIANRHLQRRVRVTIDSEGYRGRREDTLKSQAVFLASKVRESGEEAVIESLDASERRIIHTTLADDPAVYTYSEGDEPDRHVVISPKK